MAPEKTKEPGRAMTPPTAASAIAGALTDIGESGEIVMIGATKMEPGRTAMNPTAPVNAETIIPRPPKILLIIFLNLLSYNNSTGFLRSVATCSITFEAAFKAVLDLSGLFL